MNEARIKELFANEEFVKELMEKETPEEAQALFLKHDVDVPVAELKKAYQFLLEHEGEELAEEDLENVAGGFGLVVSILIIIGVGAAGGTVGGTAGALINRRARW